MIDSKVINILKKMREEEKELICADFDTETTLGYTHGDKAEALNIIIFELENKDKFYIDKSVIEDKIEELKQNTGSLTQYGKRKLIKTYEDIIKEKDKQIDLMAEYISNIQDCPLENCGVDLDCENRCDNNEKLIKECWKIYFEIKVKEENKVSWDINIKAKREISIFEANITYNLSPMYYKCLDKELGLKIFDKMTCKEALPILQKAIEDLIDNKEEYEKLNPENGWGSYEDLLIKFLEMRKCCIDNPDGIIELS